MAKPSEENSLRSHSQMLGQIASTIEDDCEGEMTTLEGVIRMKAERNFFLAVLNLQASHGIETAGAIILSTSDKIQKSLKL